MEASAYVDIAIGVLIGLSTVIGIYRGLLREVLTLLVWILGGYFALMYGQEAGDTLSIATSAKLNYWIGVAVIFFAIIIVGFVFKGIVCRLFKFTGAKPFDRLAGAIFGALRGSLIVVFVLVIGSTIMEKQTWYKQSILIPYFKVFADIVLTNMPQDWRTELDNDVKILEDSVNPEQAGSKDKAADKPIVETSDTSTTSTQDESAVKEQQ